MNITKASISLLAAAALVVGGTSAAQAYPVGKDTEILLSKSSGIRSGSMIKVKAQNVNRDCEVTFRIEDNSEPEDFDLASAFSGKNYSTAYTALQVPEAPGVYKVAATYEDTCEITGSKPTKVSFQVGKITTLSTPTVISSALLLSKKPKLTFTGNLKVRSTLGGASVNLAGQKVSVVVTVQPATGNAVSLPAIVVTTDAAGNYTGSQALTTKNLKGAYSLRATFAGDRVFSGSTSSATTAITIASVKAKLAAAKAAALKAAVRSASIAKLTR